MKPLILFLIPAALLAQSAASINVRPNLPGVANGVNVEKLLTERLSVTQFGAKCDGVTDDTAAIQRGINAINSTGVAATLNFTGVCLIGTVDAMTNDFFVWKPFVSIGGQGIILVSASAPDYNHIFNGSASTMTGLTVSDITIDENAAARTAADGTLHRVAFMTQAGDSITYRNLTFKNGNDVQTIIGDPTTNVTVSKCRFLNWGINAIAHDNSNLYITGTGAIIEGNIFQGGATLFTAIEVHGSSKRVQGNLIYGGYNNGVIVSAQTNPAVDISVTGNTIKVDQNGIEVWAVDGALQGVETSRNHIVIQNVTPGALNGGILNYVANLFAISDWTIDGNTIEFVPDSRAEPTYSLGHCIGITNGGAAGASFHRVHVSNNHLSFCRNAGVAFQTLIAGNEDIRITGNDILSPGLAGTAGDTFASGIDIFPSTTGALDTAMIAHNKITDNFGTRTMQYGIVWQGNSGDGSATSTINDNSITYMDVAATDADFYSISGGSAPNFPIQVFPDLAIIARPLQQGTPAPGTTQTLDKTHPAIYAPVAPSVSHIPAITIQSALTDGLRGGGSCIYIAQDDTGNVTVTDDAGKICFEHDVSLSSKGGMSICFYTSGVASNTSAKVGCFKYSGGIQATPSTPPTCTTDLLGTSYYVTGPPDSIQTCMLNSSVLPTLETVFTAP